MKFDFLHRESQSRLILIFAGWGSDASAFRDVAMPGWDVAVVSGIDAEVPDLSAISSYSTVYVYAWSLGVWSAERVLAGNLRPAKAFAINGTSWPCDDRRGIPCNVFKATAEGLNPRNLYKFRVRMCGGTEAYKECAALFEHVRDVEVLRCELEYVMREHREDEPLHLQWDVAYIGKYDHIFPAENQMNAWGVVTHVSLIDAPHYVAMQQIVQQTIVDVEMVSRRFTRSLPTYDAHAHAQRLIAENLAGEMGKRMLPGICDGVVEIGCGTGVFTREWSKHLKVRQAVFIDLCEMPEFAIAEEEKYIRGDAELEMARMAAEYSEEADAVLSASAIQWFSNLPLFFANCAAVLKRGGLLAVSTFAPGNLAELQRLRPDHLQYVDASTLRTIVSEYFEEVEVSEGKIELEFSSATDALRHLQLTGVTASGSRRASVAELRRFAATYPMNVRGRYPLTFRPIYILAQKPCKG